MLYCHDSSVAVKSRYRTKCSSLFKDVRAHCYCALVCTLFTRNARATSFSSARTESKTQQNIELIHHLCVNLLCEYFFWMLGDLQIFFGRSLPFLILSIILKNKKIYTWKVLIISHILFTKMDTGVLDLEVAYIGLILPDLMTYGAKIYQIGLYMLC